MTKQEREALKRHLTAVYYATRGAAFALAKGPSHLRAEWAHIEALEAVRLAAEEWPFDPGDFMEPTK